MGANGKPKTRVHTIRVRVTTEELLRLTMVAGKHFGGNVSATVRHGALTYASAIMKHDLHS